MCANPRSPGFAFRKKARGVPAARQRRRAEQMDDRACYWSPLFVGIIFAIAKMGAMLATLSRPDLGTILRGAGATFLARRSHPGAGRPVDHPGGSLRGIAPEARRPRSTRRASRRFRARHGAVPHRAAVPDSHRRRTGNRLHRADAAGHAMVHPVQRHRRRERHPHGS